MPSATRRQGREWAVQMLFQADLNPGVDVDEMIKDFWEQQWTCQMDANHQQAPTRKQAKKRVPDRVAPHDIREFAEFRVRGVLEHQDEIDQLLQKFADNWSLYRIATVERNVLRLCCFELLYCPAVPPAVVLNEAVDLAKYFSNTEAGRFVNGILDKINKTYVAKAQAEATKTPASDGAAEEGLNG
ncbi:MAG: transcription antitermination factor NusB [Kiritimatiellae bacterium]|nr:transcription antitermination factor NusB [Kiritimatiellia bacterium]